MAAWRERRRRRAPRHLRVSTPLPRFTNQRAAWLLQTAVVGFRSWFWRFWRGWRGGTGGWRWDRDRMGQTEEEEGGRKRPAAGWEEGGGQLPALLWLADMADLTFSLCLFLPSSPPAVPSLPTLYYLLAASPILTHLPAHPTLPHTYPPHPAHTLFTPHTPALPTPHPLTCLPARPYLHT